MMIKPLFLSGMAFGVLLFFNGCSATGPKFSEFKKPLDQNKGLLYIYRPSLLNLAAIDYDVNIFNSLSGNQKFSSIENGSYKEIELTPGTNKIRLQPTGILGMTALSTNAVTVDVAAGEVYCIKYKAPDISIDIGLKQPKIEIVDSQQCKAEIVNTKKAQ